MPRKIKKKTQNTEKAYNPMDVTFGGYRVNKDASQYFKTKGPDINPGTHRWLYHYLYPDRYNAERMPDYVAFPSYIFRHRLERTSTIQQANAPGDFIATWAPLNSAQYKLCGVNTSVNPDTSTVLGLDIGANAFLMTTDGYLLSRGYTAKYNAGLTGDWWINGVVNTTISPSHKDMYLIGANSMNGYYTGNLADHPFFVYNSGLDASHVHWAFVAYSPYDTPTVPGLSGLFGNGATVANGLPVYTQDACTLFQNFSTARLVSGFFRGKVTSNVLNIQGIIKICMTLYTPRNKIKTINNISRTTLNTGSVYKVYTANQGFVIYYRLVNEQHTEYAPYPDEIDNSPKLPVYIVDISGLPVGSQIIYESTRYHEGIPLQGLVDLLNPQAEGFDQVDVKSQFKKIALSPGDSIIPYQQDADLAPVITTLNRLVERQ